MPRLRLGVALLVPPPVAGEVDVLRRACGDGAYGKVPPHLTLVPPVNVRQERLGDALSVLRAAAGGSRPLRLRLGPPATFWPDTPVLLLPVAGDVEAVHALRDAVLTDPLARRLTWPFVPHVTLADEAPPERLAAAVTALTGYVTWVTVGSVTLLEERKDPDRGRVWEPLADAALGRPAVVGRGGLPVEITEGASLDPEARAVADRAWAELDRPPRQGWALTARREDEVVAVATGWVDGELAYLEELVVRADVRGQGVGGHLLRAAEALAVGRGAARLAVRAEAGGDAEGFYRRHGFAGGVRLRAWRRGRDHVQLERRLAPG